MNTKLNWNKFLLLKRKTVILIIILFLPVMLFIQAIPKQVNDIVAKSKSVVDENDNIMKAYIALRSGGIGGDFPCGFAMGIALEDFGRYIFSAQSGFLATFLPGTNDHTFPTDTSWTAKLDKEFETMSYQEAFKRTKNLSIGTFEGTYGKRWAITDEQAADFYDQVHTVNLGGEIYTAFDQNNMFYEGLISTQLLIKKTEEQAALINELIDQNKSLTARLERIEQELGISNTLPNVGEIAISPNPGKTNFIGVEFQLYQEMNNASFVIADIQGKTMHKINLQQTEGKLQIDNNLPAGTYLCYLYNNSFRSIAEKLIIQ